MTPTDRGDMPATPPAPLAETPTTQRQPPTSHRALAQLAFPPRRWLHVTVLPALLCGALLLAGSSILQLWAAALDAGLLALGLNGVIVTRPLDWAALHQARLLIADVPAAAPSAEQLMVGVLLAAALGLVSVVIPAERAPLRYLLRALLLCHAASLTFFGLMGGRLPYSLGDHVSAGMTAAWVFILLVPWLHAASFNVFGFGLWRKAALSLVTLSVLLLLVPLQYLFHIAVIQPFSLLQLPLLYLFAGLMLEVMVFISLYAWAMSWAAPEDAH
jgi:hypothetical protein